MKLLLISLAVLFSLSAQAFDFIGRWTVDNIECIESGNALTSYPSGFDVRCSEPIKEFIFSYDSGFNYLNVQFLKKYESNPLDWWVKETFGDGHLVSPYKQQKLSISNDQVLYVFKKAPAPLDDTSIETYTFNLRKMNENKYVVIRHYTFKNEASPYFKGKFQDVTQTLYLSR